MPLFLDVHNVPSGQMPSDEEIAQAHAVDLRGQDQYGVKYHRYFVSRDAGKIYCVVEAPDRESADRVHQEAHGMMADEMHEVTEGS